MQYTDGQINDFITVELRKDIPLEHNINGILNYIFNNTNSPHELYEKTSQINRVLYKISEISSEKQQQLNRLVEMCRKINECNGNMYYCIREIENDLLDVSLQIMTYILCFARSIFDKDNLADNMTFTTPQPAISIAMGEDPWSVFLKYGFPRIFERTK